jgi:RNA recognition motif-containing protein
MKCNIFSNQENKIFMGNLPLNLDEEDIKHMLESFGKLKNFSLVKSAAVGGSSRGF